MEYRMQMQMQQKRPMLTGNKKVPVTKPYVEMLMLYDALKREAKAQGLHKFGVSWNPKTIHWKFIVSIQPSINER